MSEPAKTSTVRSAPVQTSRPVGRPSSYSDDVAGLICLRLSNGEPLKKICSDPSMPDYSTVWRWVEKHPEFRAVSLRAREIGTHAIADECVEIADNPDLDPNDKKVRIDTRLRLIGKWNRKVFGDRQEISGVDGAPIEVAHSQVLQLENLDDTQRDQLREILEAARANQAVDVTPREGES